MKSSALGCRQFALVVAGLHVPLAVIGAQPLSSPLERYRKLEFPPSEENFDKGWKDRVALEFQVVNAADLGTLRTALKDPDPLVRSMAARTLGIRGDKDSAESLAELVKSDSEYMVRIRAVEALGHLKMRAEAIDLAKKDAHLAVQWAADTAARQIKSDTDYASQMRQAFAAGIKRASMDSAIVGQKAPDIAALTIDGKPFKLSDVLGKKPIAIYFAAFDG